MPTIAKYLGRRRMIDRRILASAAAVAVAALAGSIGSFAQAPTPGGPAPGVSASEIKIGQTMPYTGPVAAFSALGKGEIAYFKKVNAEGGINGRKINLLS